MYVVEVDANACSNNAITSNVDANTNNRQTQRCNADATRGVDKQGKTIDA